MSRRTATVQLASSWSFLPRHLRSIVCLKNGKIVGARRDDDVGLPLANLASNRAAVFQGRHQLAVVNLEDFGLDPQDLGAALHLGGSTAGQDGPCHLVVAYVAIGHELDLVPELDPSRGGSTGREFAIVRMGPKDDHAKWFFSRMANLTGEAQESTNFYGKRSRLLAVCAMK